MSSTFYSVRSPYKKGYLDVGGGHTIFYHCYGNKNGRPVLFLHGGPGAGTKRKDAKYFNPRLYNVILFDQRGAGKSIPFASLKNNTTSELISDINKLLDHFGIKKVFLFGGSWGSTLALAYAIRNKERVTGMLLRGIFLCTSEEKKEFFGQKGLSARLFPDAWERFAANAPRRLRKNPAKLSGYYLTKMNSSNKKVSDKYKLEWTIYEISMMKLVVTQKDMNEFTEDGVYKSLAPIEATYYGGNNYCFLPQGFIEKNASKLSGIPVVIVHGRYDAICMPASAYKLHKLIRGSKLYFVISGHGSSDKAMARKLKEEMDKFAD